MIRDEVVSTLRTNVGKQVRVTYADGESEPVTIVNLDDEGFVNQWEGNLFWTAFEDISDVQQAAG